MKRNSSARIIVITGTNTGVGKTVLTGLLLSHLRQTGRPVAALKPFCSGSRADAELLYRLLDRELALDDINPWYFPEPVAPLVAARKHHRRITLRQVLSHITLQRSTLQRSTLLIEGAGGLLVPLGENFTVLDLIARLHCEVLLVAANRLGTINHTLLSVQALKTAGLPCRVVLMETPNPDVSAATNPRVLRQWLAGIPLFHLPFLGPHCASAVRIRARAARLRPALARILSP